MSELSEALERQLRKLMPLPTPVVKVRKATLPKLPDELKAVIEVKSIHLAYQEGSSDKEYLVQIVNANGGFEVHFQYGRRGKTLQKGTKTSGAVSFSEARSIYDNLVDEKLAKGYKEI
jgi:predicted DNA-binding WGR domain protein